MNKEVKINGNKFLLRELRAKDKKQLYNFLIKLSKNSLLKSFRNSNLKKTAEEYCKAIGKYDKYRYILLNGNKIIGLFEFSLDLSSEDIERFKKYTEIPKIEKICRWGLTITDEYQNQKIAQNTFKIMKQIAKSFKKTHIILLGGVYTTNERAIHFYEKVGFKKIGTFKDKSNNKSIDMILKI